jgi:hypothetical protein
MIEPIQIQLIHIAKAQLGLSEDDYRQIIGAQTKGKKQSSKELTYFEADGLINYFKTLGFTVKSHYNRGRKEARIARRGGKNVISLPSPEEMGMIEALKAKVHWRFEDGYERWLSKYMRIERVMTAPDAYRVIEGLKKLIQHQG